jgi:hypothetical protein
VLILVIASEPCHILEEFKTIRPLVLLEHSSVIDIHHVGNVLPHSYQSSYFHILKFAIFIHGEEPDRLSEGGVKHIE